jgi:hypothetical protein
MTKRRRDRDKKIATLISTAYNKQVACILHPEYYGDDKPTTEETSEDGCTCHIFYWTRKLTSEERN